MTDAPFYQIAEKYQSIVDLMDDLGDEPDESLLEALTTAMAEIEDEIGSKAENIVALLASWEALEAAIKLEVDRLRDRQKSLQRRSERLRAYMIRHMQGRGIKKIETPIRNISLVQGRERVIVDDLDKLPQGTFDTEYVIKPDKKLIMERHKAGMETEGAHIERGDDYLLIR